MSKYVGIFGQSKVAKLWKEVYENTKLGDDFDKIKKVVGEANETNTIDEHTIQAIYSSSEWKGILRGGTIVRQMTFIVKDGKIVSKSNKNLNMSAW